MPRTRAARLKQLFTKAAATEHDEDELSRWCQRAREAVLQAACTLQYDSAVYSGAQLGVTLRPKPFSSRQQQHSRFDGRLLNGTEYAVDSNGEVTGFCMPNKDLASAEQIKDDCDAWNTSFACNQRASFNQNHYHQIRFSSSDVLQATLGCNADYQYQKTGAAQEPSATEQRQSTESHNLTAFFLYGCGVVNARTSNQCQQLLIMTTIETAMRLSLIHI